MIDDLFQGKKIWWQGKVLGVITKDLNFYTVRKPEHLFRMFNGFGLNKLFLDHLIQRGIKLIYINYNGDIYSVKPENWKINGTDYHHQDYEPQLILPLEKFDSVKKKAQQQLNIYIKKPNDNIC